MSESQNNLAATYQKKTDIEHIKDAPDTYIGAVEEDRTTNWSFHGDKIAHREYAWIPGLYKCFDEGIVNCRDHAVRLEQKIAKGVKDIRPVTLIDISVDKDSGVITMLNDGDGIDVEMHPEHKMWIPEMIFGHLRTSTNYQKTEKKIVGGKNGFGFKLVLIYSLWGTIETVDHRRGLKYTQTFRDNLGTIEKPKIRKCTKTKPYTKVSWLPDYERFGITRLSGDMFDLFKKRTYDIAAITDKKVRVRFNHQPLPIRTLEQYINLYIGPKLETKRVYERGGERWEYAVCLSPNDEFTHVTFANGIYTSKGGRHVDYVLGQIVKGVSGYIEKKKKIKVKPTTIKEQLMLFVNCVVENPTFDSQTKDYMNTPISKFGSRCSVSSKFIERVVKLGVMDAAISLTEIKDSKAAKKTDGKKTRTIRGIPKLIDANYAGGAKSDQCVLILCEGDSAKAGIVSGLSKDDRNYYGVFPLKGKLLNAKDASQHKLNDNAEITSIKKILGLETNKEYKDPSKIRAMLRYGRIRFMTDQDLDGSHIKGLCINLFHSQWSNLVKLESYLGFMNTPILKAKKGSQTISFYNEAEYTSWKAATGDGKGWKVKYYKGLGTSTAKEFREYFEQKKEVVFAWGGSSCDDALDLVFNKKRADDRKEWLGSYNKDAVLDTSRPEITYKEFVNEEMIHFSNADCARSLPNLMDGLKISSRKIMFAAFKRNLTAEVKVSQFAGYVSEHSAYHHGENSLKGAIVNMAQEFTGSNNINLLLPNGQFGSRLQGGKDAASDRYIFTALNPLTRFIYPEADFAILNYMDDDGTSVEPDFYCPIIPMCLVNGGKGIGTGFSYEGLCYNPIDVVDNLRKRLRSPCDPESLSSPSIEPYYEGYKGRIIKISPYKYLFKGCYEVINENTVRITELPIGIWTDDYKDFLEALMDGGKDKKAKPIVDRISDMSTHTAVDITVKLKPGVLAKLAAKIIDEHCNGFEKKFKLCTTRTTTNMHLFDAKRQLKRYATVEDIIDKYYPVRHSLYVKRREHQLRVLRHEADVLSNKARFIIEQCEDIIDLRRKKKQVIVDLLSTRGYNDIDNNDFKYLLKLPSDSVLEENAMKLHAERDCKLRDVETLKGKSVEDLWGEELDAFVTQYHRYRIDRENRQRGATKKAVSGRRKKVKVTKT